MDEKNLCKLTDRCHASASTTALTKNGWYTWLMLTFVVFEKTNWFFVGHGSGRIVSTVPSARVAGLKSDSRTLLKSSTESRASGLKSFKILCRGGNQWEICLEW